MQTCRHVATEAWPYLHCDNTFEVRTPSDPGYYEDVFPAVEPAAFQSRRDLRLSTIRHIILAEEAWQWLLDSKNDQGAELLRLQKSIKDAREEDRSLVNHAETEWKEKEVDMLRRAQSTRNFFAGLQILTIVTFGHVWIGDAPEMYCLGDRQSRANTSTLFSGLRDVRLVGVEIACRREKRGKLQ